MYISLNWLEKYLPEIKNFEPQLIADTLTKGLAEVEQFEPVRSDLKNIVVGKVTSVDPHPDSKKLKICKVLISGDTTNTIVCGAPNVKENILVAVCLPGGQVYHPDGKSGVLQIMKTAIKGFESAGMICSEKELRLGKDHNGILEIEGNYKPGDNLDFLLHDIVFEIENKSISHRSDCFSHHGIARELAALLKTKYLEPAYDQITYIPVEEKDFRLDIKINKQYYQRFTALVITDVEVKSSPLWLKAALSGIKEHPVNNIVDIANYIMFDTGQPFHIYDYDRLSEKALIVRKAKSGEKITTLDDETYTLDNDMVVITDGDTIEDIAGIKGGNKTQVTETTKTIVIEAATFEMYNIRRTSRNLGLRSEASTRFEKGLDPELPATAIKLAVTLLNDLSGGEIASELMDDYPEPLKETELDFDITLANKILSKNLTKQQISELLTAINLEVIGEQGNELQLKIPSYRKDLKIPEDIVEELARLTGFENLDPRLPQKDLTPIRIPQKLELMRKVTRILAHRGMTEIKTYSFVGDVDYEQANLTTVDLVGLINPIAPELKYLRAQLLPSLLTAAVFNSSDRDEFRLFELNRVIKKDLDENELHLQPWYLSGLICDENTDYFEIKGLLEFLLKNLHVKCQFRPLEETKAEDFSATTFHPLQSAAVISNNTVLGILGMIHPQVLHQKKLSRATGFEINFDLLSKQIQPPKRYEESSNLPVVKRDLSFWFEDSINYQAILDLLDKISLEDASITKVDLVDIYKPQDEKRKSITLRLILQSKSHTLAEKEINVHIESIIKQISGKLKGELRQ